MKETTYANEEIIDRILSALAFKRKLLGFGYLREAIVIACSHSDGRAVLSKEVYPVIAERHSKKDGSVEHAIRNAIGICYYQGNLKSVNTVLRANIVDSTYPPTNGEFIAAVAAFILRLGNSDIEQFLNGLDHFPADKK